MENNSSSNSRFEFGAAILAGIAGIAVGAIGMSVMTRYRPTSESKSSKSSSAGNDLDCAYGKLVGNTALVKLNALSEALDCDIFVKVRLFGREFAWFRFDDQLNQCRFLRRWKI